MNWHEINILIGFLCIYCTKIFCDKECLPPPPEGMHTEFCAWTLTITVINIDVSDQMSCENEQNNTKLQHSSFISIS